MTGRGKGGPLRRLLNLSDAARTRWIVVGEGVAVIALFAAFWLAFGLAEPLNEYIIRHWK